VTLPVRGWAHINVSVFRGGQRVWMGWTAASDAHVAALSWPGLCGATAGYVYDCGSGDLEARGLGATTVTVTARNRQRSFLVTVQ